MRIVRAGALTAVVLWLMTLAQGAVLIAADDLRLLEAVQRQDRQAVRTLVNQHVDVNAARGDGLTALAIAVHQDDVEAVDLLMRAGARVNAANDLGMTPLMLAAINGNSTIVDRLLKGQADPNAARSTGETAMVFAARTGNPAVIRLLLAAGAAADNQIGARGQTPLMWAAAEGHADAVKLLLEVGAKSETMTKTIQYEASYGHYVAKRKPLERVDKTRSVITILWPKDGDGDLTRHDGGMTALLFAIDGGHQDAVGALLDGGANVNGANPDGLTPLEFAMIRRNEALALYLLERGADPNAGPGCLP